MNDIIKEVKTKYPDIHIDKQTCPSYVKMYTKDNRQIVMVYVEVTPVMLLFLFNMLVKTEPSIMLCH